MADILGYIVERSINDSGFLPGLFLVVLSLYILVLFLILRRDS